MGILPINLKIFIIYKGIKTGMRHIYRLYERNLMKPSRFDFAVTVYNRFVSFTGCLP